MNEQPHTGSGYQGKPMSPPDPDGALGDGSYRYTEQREGGSVGGLLRQLTQEVTSLFTKEVALARAEASDSLHAAKAGVAAVAAGGAVLLSGFIILLMSAVYGLSNVVAPWLAALIVGGIVAIIGLIMVQSGKKKLEPRAFKPERTMNAARADAETVRRGRHEH